jgi:membrane protein YqaA with SNARE-associated domain
VATDPTVSAVWFYLAAVVSAVVPWVNAEVLMVSAVPLAGSTPHLAGLVTAVTLGQMTGKSVMFVLARRSSVARWPRTQTALDRWRDRLATRPTRALALTFVSALVGVPPFFAVSLAAGAVGLSFGPFLAVGTVGRLIHFAVVAGIPELLRRVS